MGRRKQLIKAAMGSTEVMCPTTSRPLTVFHPTDCCRPPSRVALSVTADVHVYRYDDSRSSADESSSRVVVVTSLSAMVEELSSAAVLSKRDEYLFEPFLSPSTSFEVHSHPRVRGSKKSTCLTKTARRTDVQTSISRMVLLSYPTCSEDDRKKATQREKFFIKTSKTWETVNVPGGRAVRKRVRSHTQSVNKLRSAVGGRSSTKGQFDLNSLTDNAISGLDRLSRPNLRQSLSESQVLFKDEQSRTFLCSLLDEYRRMPSAVAVKSPRSDLGALLAGFEEGLFAPDTPPKSTRNVSILHRPRTRTTATSTSSLDAYSEKKQQNLGDTLKEALRPYLAAGNYPSELVLKLVPKKRVEEEMRKMEHEADDGSRRHSEEDLLAPKLDIVKAKTLKKSKKGSKKKTKKRSGFLCCFSKPTLSAGAESDDLDDKSGATKVYYPSIVEVHEGKRGKRLVDDDDSDLAYVVEHSIE